MERVAVKIEGRDRVALLDPETAREIVAEGRGTYLDSEPVETAAVEPPENAAARTGRAPSRGR